MTFGPKLLPGLFLLCLPAAVGANAAHGPRDRHHHHHHGHHLSGQHHKSGHAGGPAAGRSGRGHGTATASIASIGAIGWPDAQKDGWNHGEALLGGIRRIPLSGLHSIGHDPAPGPNLERADRRAVVLIPKDLDPGEPIEVLLHLHGYHNGYRQEHGGTRADPIRDRDVDRIEAQMEESGRGQLIAVLPQGSFNSDFSPEVVPPGKVAKIFAADELIGEVLDRLSAARLLPGRPEVRRVLFSAHSGGGEALGLMLEGPDTAPEALAAVALFDAINGPREELPRLEHWLARHLDLDLGHLRSADADGKRRYLQEGLRFRAYHTPGGHYGPLHNDPAARFPDPALVPLQQFLDGWFHGHEEALGGPDGLAYRGLHDNYRVIEVPGVVHDAMMSSGILRDALRALPPDDDDDDDNVDEKAPKGVTASR